MVNYAILGPVELSDGERLVSAGGPRQVALLAFLLVHANRAVSPDALLDELWGEQPAVAGKRVQMAIARLRKALEIAGGGAPSPLRTVAGGYLLAVAPGELDAQRFETQLQEGRSALEQGDVTRAGVCLRAALALWRGPALADVGYEDWARAEIRRLEELRLAALEWRIEADLRSGRHAELAAELQGLVAAYPARERLTEQLMLTLYRCGRQGEALDVYQRTRTHLSDELGLEPGPGLRALQAQILAQSDVLQHDDGDAGASARLGDGPTTAAPRPAATPESPAAGPRGYARRLVAVLAARANVTDPEVLHGVFDRCTAIVEQHGGTVERYLGDALVGFFGLARSNGDDALRAARAAVELRAATTGLRLGIELGEVFIETGARGETIAVGAAISAAGALAERAPADEIMLGADIARALAGDIRVDANDGRLLELGADMPAFLRAPQTPFIGRARPIADLHAEFERVCEQSACRLVTVAGSPGIGKSRLAGEFIASLEGRATVLGGRCLAYGEGTAYHALLDIARGIGSDVRERVAELAADEQVLRCINSALGVTDEPVQMEETSWALRRLLERLARDRPVVVAIEDIHWAEPPLLGLIDHVVALSSGAPILVVCLTRPELIESRPAWAAPQPNRSLLMLEPLPAADALDLAERLGATQLATRIAERAEGNPLFIEQLVAVGPGREGELPASIHAVLAARIDRLDPPERALLQLASVEGRTFHTGAIDTQLPPAQRHAMATRLVALTHKGLISASAPEYPDEDAFRFTHALIREAAYACVPKVQRAQVHAGVAAWLEDKPEAQDQVVGYHLEQACHLRAELAAIGATERAWAARAVGRFKAASRAALWRGDPASSVTLLERAVALVADDPAARSALLPALGASLFEAGRMADAERVLDDAVAHPHDERLRARAAVEREFVRLESQTSSGTTPARAVVNAAASVLERAGDDDGLSRLWCLRATVAWNEGCVAQADTAWCRAAEYAGRSRDERQLYDTVMRRASAAVFGPMPVDEGIRLCEEIRELVHGAPVADTATMQALASLHAMTCDFERARELLAESNEIRLKLGDIGSSVSHHEALIEMFAGRPERAERRLRGDLATLERIGDCGMLATTQAMLGQALYAQGRPQEAQALCRRAAQLAAADDIVTRVLWRGVQARIAADAGDVDEGEALAREAVALVKTTDLLTLRGDVMLDLAHVLSIAGKMYQDTVRSALQLYGSKGNVAASLRASSMLEQHPGRETHGVQQQL